ncbi:hypothetical protein GCM10027275_14690 [Rhabdobacter roseus]|uniref:Uncharacterized protein n=1 Tax=Rhabdobacter roseus TaxID=1655419 RepID=A0A840TUN1_9BACT|nr:hypothetical protein [Rhabdobacter roseus]MBB5283389.1 hypothetical protein [Rhabdobacter roseus]
MKIEEKKKGIIGLLLWLIIFGVGLAIYALFFKKYDILVSSLALIISTISASFAYEVIFRDAINKLPHVIVEFDGESRYQIWQLVFKNIGGSTAYNIRLSWHKS